MKKIIICMLAVLFPSLVFAQNMQEQDMEKMMEMAMKMQACMEKVDQAELEALGQRAEKFEAEVKKLCDAGKRKEAQKKAIAFSKEFEKNPALVQMQKCGEMAQGMMPETEMDFMDGKLEDENAHVCDSL